MKFKRICLIAAIIFFSNAHASEPSRTLNLKEVECGEKATELLKKWGALDDWRLTFNENEEEKRYQTPTGVLGKWVQVKYTGKKNLTLTLFTETSALTVSFDAKCTSSDSVKALKEGARLPTSIQGFPAFRDTNIEKLFKEKKPALLFLWSPHMQISVEALKEIITATKNQGIPLYALVEPGSDGKIVDQTIKQLGVPRKEVYFLDSFDLSLRNFRLHFPSLIIVNRGQYTSQVRRGHETAEVYEEFIKTHL